MASVDELEAQIRQQPDDLDLRIVHADAVLERGGKTDKARGQLIQLALAGERGDAAAANKAWVLQRKVRARLVKALDSSYVVRLGWRHGSVESVVVEPRGRSRRQAPDKALRALFAQPELFALRSFDTRSVWNTAWSGLPDTVELSIELVRHLPVRWLGVCGLTASEQLDRLHELPQLDGLGIVTNTPEATLEALVGHTWLRDLELGDSVNGPLAARIIETCPQLTRLVLFGLSLPAISELAPVFERRALPALRDLGIMAEPEIVISVLRRLAETPLLPQLGSLGFCAAAIYDDDDGRSWFEDQRAAFAHLRLFTAGRTPASDRGHEAGRLGMLLDAIDRDREAIEEQMHHLDHSGTDKVHASCWTRLANDLITVDHYDEALRMADRAIEVAGADSTAWMWRTRVHALDYLDRHAEAEESTEKALAIEEGCSWTWRFRGGALRQLGRFDEAAVAFDRAIDCVKDGDPQSYRTWAHLLRGELRWGCRELDHAIADLEVVVGDANDTEATKRARLALGSIAYQRGDLAAARPHFVEALAVSARDDSDAISSLCFTLFELGHYELALTTWQLAPAQFEWNDIDEQGHVLIAMGRPADALTALAAGRQVGGARAMALHALGRSDEAIAAVDDYAHRPRLDEPSCAARLATGLVLQGLLLRAAGREREAKQRFAKLRNLPEAPGELHIALSRKLRGHDTSCCHMDACERPAAAAAIAAALARGDVDEAAQRARVLSDHVESKLASRVPVIDWDLRSIHQLAPSPLLQQTIAVVERCAVLDA